MKQPNSIERSRQESSELIPTKSKLLVWVVFALILALVSGGTAAAIAVVELIELATAHAHQSSLPFMPVTYEHTVSFAAMILMVLGGLIGTLAFSGSLIAFAKLQGWMTDVISFRGQRPLSVLAFLATLNLGGLLVYQTEMIPGTTIIFAANFPIEILLGFFILALVLGVMITKPIGRSDMPVVISLINVLTGLAVGFEGFALGSAAIMIAGAVIASTGFLLTQLIAKAMNRTLSNVLFSHFGSGAA